MIANKRRQSVDDCKIEDINKKAFEDHINKFSRNQNFSNIFSRANSCINMESTNKGKKKKKLTWAKGKNLKITHKILVNDSVWNLEEKQNNDPYKNLLIKAESLGLDFIEGEET